MLPRSPRWIPPALLCLGLAACAPVPKAASTPCPEAGPAAVFIPGARDADPSGRVPVPEDEGARVEALMKAFERAVARHDRKRVLDALDPDYLKKEFQEYYNRDTTAFLDDFFCGWTPDSTQSLCLPFDSVEELERTGLEYDRGPDRFSAHYLVKASARSVRATLQVMPSRSVSFGVLGSRGFTQVE